MIAKLITHGSTRDIAIARMREALNEFVIRGVSSNIGFQSALMQHPRFHSGNFNTGFIAEEFPSGFSAESLVHSNPMLLVSVAAFMRRRQIERATRTSGQLVGHGRKVGTHWVVTVDRIEGGYDVTYEGETHVIKSDWKLGEFLFRGTYNGEPVCLQVERTGLRIRMTHWGTQAVAMVMTARAAHLLSLMPEKPKPDLSKFLLSPMPGLLSEMPLKAGQEVKGGEKLAVIEAMKMENILKADHDCVVAEVLARQGDSLAVDQPIVRFQ
jgi:propionyl-CoA carboxylase alpha chain